MTWKDLASYISEMTEEEKEQKVKYVDPYDDFQIQSCSLEFADSNITDESGDTIAEGEWYLC